MTKRMLVSMALLGLMAAGTAAAQSVSPKDTKQQPQEQQQQAPAPNDTGYMIGPDDVLNVNVWKEPEVSAQAVPVRPDGKISLPLINDVQAAGLTPMQLSEQVTQSLKKYIDQPRVTVTVAGINSKRVFILGQVQRPGAFTLLPEMTVLQALSSAGGLSIYANASKIYVLRNVNGAQTKLSFNYKQVVRGQSPEQNIVLKAGDTIVVP